MAFCLRRPLLKMVSEATGIAVPKRIRPPEEIRSREDVISAFHALALNSRQHVESWWTHRAAAQKLAAASPLKENAVQTLAEIYEHARYLPDDVELPGGHDSVGSNGTGRVSVIIEWSIIVVVRSHLDLRDLPSTTKRKPSWPT